MEISFNNKIVLVTGASRGIGAPTARLFAESKATVVVHYHQNKQAAESVLATFPGSGHSFAQADMAQPGDLKEMVSEVVKKYGRIDILVNNAGIYEEDDMAEMPFDEFKNYWEKTIHVNLTGPALLSQLVAKEMIKTGGGRIINVTSRGAFRGEPTSWAYGASKAGLNAFGQSMAKALAKDKIYVFTLAPGFVETDMSEHCLRGAGREEITNQSPMKHIAQPEEIAHAIILLSADGNEYMTGCVVDMNGASYLRT